jgi:hypothetical protein
MPDEPQALPPALLYSLLRALGPKKIAKARSKAKPGEKPSPSAKRAFQALVQAADQAKTANQFAKLVGDANTNRAASHGAVTQLTVEYTSNGYTIVIVKFADGTGYIAAFPTT